MPCPTQILVSGAGLSSVNGIYLSAGNTFLDEEGVTYTVRTIYTKDGNPESFPSIQLASPQFNRFIWNIQTVIPIYGPVSVYSTALYTVSLFPQCPINLTYTKASVPDGPDPGTAPTIVEYGTEPTFGLPADVVALIESRFGTVANFLRLRNLGQI